MAITVDTLLHDTRLWDLSLVAGAGGLCTTVSKVTVMDAPDGPHWLKGGELIVTSAYMFNGDNDRLYSFCRELIDVKASAIGIKMGRYLPSLPQPLLDLCDQANMPLIIIPYSYVWTDIISVFYEISYNLSQPQKYNSIKERMIQRIKDSCALGVTSAVEAIYSFFEVPVALLNQNKTLVACKGTSDECADMHENFHLLMDEKGARAGKYYISGKYYYYGPTMGKWPNVKYIVIATDSPTVLDELREILYRAEIVPGEEKVGFETEEELYYRALSTLLSGGKLDSNIVDTLNKRGLLKNGSYVTVYIENCSGQQLKTEFLSAIEKIKGMELLFTMVSNPLNKRGMAILRFREHGTKMNPAQALRTIVCDVYDYIRAAGGQDMLYISNRYDSFSRLEMSYREALNARDYCRIINNSDRPGFFGEVYPYYLLLNSDISGHYLEDIAALADSEKQLSFNGIATLDAYLQSESFKIAAKALFIHENTLRYRVKKIEELLCVNFDPPQTRRDFLFRMNLWKLRSSLNASPTATR